MTVASPILLVPSSGANYYTDVLDHFISGTIARPSDPEVFYEVKYSYWITTDDTLTPMYSPLENYGVILTETTDENVLDIPWSIKTSKISSDIAVGKTLFVRFYALEGLSQSAYTDMKVTFVNEDQITATVLNPTGVSLSRYNTKVVISTREVILPEDSDSNLLGYNFYVSTYVGGGTTGYKKINEEIVDTVSSVLTEEVNISEDVRDAGDLRVSTKTVNRIDTNIYSFEFNKDVFTRMVTEGELPNIVYTEDSRFYFVITALAYDPVLAQVIESGYSVELEGRFLSFSTNLTLLPPRTRQDIILSINRKVVTSNKRASVISGSVIRDLTDPISEEFSRYYVVQDFVFRTNSINTLMAFDDANGDGISDPVTSSEEKTKLLVALNIRDPFILQGLIDEQFDKLASNFNLTRKQATKSVGTVTFFANDIPKEGLQVIDGALVTSTGDLTSGIASANFIVKGTRRILSEDKQLYFNSATNRYEILCTIEAESEGSDGNVPPGAISIVGEGVDSGLKVENNTSTYSGSEKESNLELANRIKLVNVSLDTGTEGGYASVALGIRGVSQVRVEKFGDPLMKRDLDFSSGTHLGGKVDIYVQGRRLRQVKDLVAFKFGSSEGVDGMEVGETFDVEDALSFKVRCKNIRVSTTTPIIKVTRVRNVTRGFDYSLEGIDFDENTITLNLNSANEAIGMATLDAIEVDYKYRSSNIFTLLNQPVDSVIEVVGDIDGPLPPENYRLIKKEDPLLNGGSSISKDGVEILFNNGKPSENDFNDILNEEHVLQIDAPSFLVNKGVALDTLVVASDSARTTIYKKDLDYSVNFGNQLDPTSIVLIRYGKIRNGQRVYVSYSASQNFTITYTTNDLIRSTQEAVSSKKHACADVVVKQAVRNVLDIACAIVRKQNVQEDTVKQKVKTVISNYIANLKMGESLSQATVVSLIKGIPEVKDLILPLQRMMKRNGSFIPQDNLGTLSFRIFNSDVGKNISSYITLRPVLSYPTSENGGDTNFFRSVYEDGVPLNLVNTPEDVTSQRGSAYIQEDGKIIVCTKDGLPPQTKKYSASYYTFAESTEETSSDIQVDPIEYLTVDSNSLVIDASLEEQTRFRGI